MQEAQRRRTVSLWLSTDCAGAGAGSSSSSSVWPSAGRYVTRSFCWKTLPSSFASGLAHCSKRCQHEYAGCRINGVRTMSCRARFSLSGVMIVLWMRNLSLHFVFSGGSSLSACSITATRSPVSPQPCHPPWRQRALTRHIDAFPGLDSARVRAHAV